MKYDSYCIRRKEKFEVDFYLPACKFAYCACYLISPRSKFADKFDSRIAKFPEITECWQCDDCEPKEGGEK